MGNPFVHVELATGDVSKARKFYKSLFDWKLTDMPGMAYTMLDVGTGTGGGMMQKPMPDAPTAWLPYVLVDDVKKTVAKARKAGANVVVEYQPVGEMGAFGIFIDPTGAALGVFEAWAAQPAKKGAKKGAKKAAKAPTKKAATKKGGAKKKGSKR